MILKRVKEATIIFLSIFVYFLDPGSKKKKGTEEEPEINFEEISKEIAKADEKQHIDQIGPAVTDAYLKNAKYVDEKGVIRFKTKFSKDEAKRVANDVYDALGYHSHRRVFGLNEEQYNALKGFKDPNGTPYVDAVTDHHYDLKRKELEQTLAREDKDNEITHIGLEELLKKHIQHHASLLTQGLISKHGLDDPEHMNKVKGAIDKIVEKYHLDKKKFNTKKMYRPEDVIKTYVGLSAQYAGND